MHSRGNAHHPTHAGAAFPPGGNLRLGTGARRPVATGQDKTAHDQRDPEEQQRRTNERVTPFPCDDCESKERHRSQEIPECPHSPFFRFVAHPVKASEKKGKQVIEVPAGRVTWMGQQPGDYFVVLIESGDDP